MKQAIIIDKEYKFEINLIEPKEHRMILNLAAKDKKRIETVKDNEPEQKEQKE